MILGENRRQHSKRKDGQTTNNKPSGKEYKDSEEGKKKKREAAWKETEQKCSTAEQQCHISIGLL